MKANTYPYMPWLWNNCFRCRKSSISYHANTQTSPASQRSGGKPLGNFLYKFIWAHV